MSKIINVVENQVIRNEVLEICQQAQPYGANINILMAMLKKLGYTSSKDQVLSTVAYLENKGYVNTKNVGNERLGIEKTIIQITAAGIDFLEGSANDVGIESGVY